MKHMNSLLTITTICLIIASSALADGDSAAKDSSAKKLFKEAFFQQTIEGDIAQAIELYQKGLKEPDLSAKLAATAYYQLGICFEKQNQKTAAQECYQKIIDHYSSESENVAKAKKKLSSLSDTKTQNDYVAYLDNLPVERLDIKDPKVTRQYIKEKFGPPQFEHGRGLFINYGGKYSLRFDMNGDRVRAICLFKTFPGEIQAVDAQGELSTYPPLEKDLVSSKIELRKAKEKQYTAYLENLPVDFLDPKDPKVTRQYIKEKFGPPQSEHPRGLFLNYGAKYGLRFDMDGDRVREICLFKTFPGMVYSGLPRIPGIVYGGSDFPEESTKKISPLQNDLKGQIFLALGKGPIEVTLVDEDEKPIADVKVQAFCALKNPSPSQNEKEEDSSSTDTVTVAYTTAGTDGKTDSQGHVFLAGSSKNWDLFLIECQHNHYATKLIHLPFPDMPEYEKKMAGEVPLMEGVQFKDRKCKIVLDKGASLRGTAYFFSGPDGKTKVPAIDHNIGLASKGRGGTKATIKNHRGEFFFDGIMETEVTGYPPKMHPAVWELSCKREGAPNSEWATKEFTFEKGEQAVAEIAIKYDQTTGKQKITITRLPSQKAEADKTTEPTDSDSEAK